MGLALDNERFGKRRRAGARSLETKIQQYMMPSENPPGLGRIWDVWGRIDSFCSGVSGFIHDLEYTRHRAYWGGLIRIRTVPGVVDKRTK